MHFGMLTLLTQPTEAQIKHQNREETSFTLNMVWLLVPLGFSHRTTLLFTCRKWSEKKIQSPAGQRRTARWVCRFSISQVMVIETD